MSMSRIKARDRLDELLATRATQCLNGKEQQELDTLLDGLPGVDDLAWDRTAAALDLALLDPVEIEPMPVGLRSRISDLIPESGDMPDLRLVSDASAPSDPVVEVRTRGGMPRAVGWLGWAAAAACLAFAAVVSFPTSPQTQTPAELHAELTTVPGIERISWNDAADLGVTGEVLWDQATQRGVMMFTGLSVNDPEQMQYQLWIFDDGRGTAATDGAVHNAVDGGVFDIDVATGTVYIPIDPKLNVFEPTLFAITTEPPGGVVKHITHDEYRIILTAG